MAPSRSRRWRSRVKATLASTISRSLDLGLARALARGPERPLILGYHRIVDDFDETAKTEMPAMLTSRAMFERHLDVVGRHFRFVSLDEIGAHLAAGEPFRERVAAVTFDDGYEDVYEQAFPVLRRKGIPSAVFVVTNLVGRDCWQVHDKLYHLVAKAYTTWGDPHRELAGLLDGLGLPAGQMLTSRGVTHSPTMTVASLLPQLSQADVGRIMAGLEATVGNGCHHVPRTMSWEMVQTMHRAGVIFGSHTESHISLPTEALDTVTRELVESKRVLESRIGAPVQHFAYPGGQFTPRDVDALAAAGYRYGYTACPHNDPRHPLLTIERLLLWEGSSTDGEGEFSPAILRAQVHDLWPPARACAREHHA